ncbi:MAG: large conductance mechanosensitive channel protein MscL [Coriobacteriales bacterium]|jgi:large conductance mechanosensitive channel|nr:large conductance mechanosensitive channel protein MscL [Coriobacteriales bacterium]
MKFFKDFGAFIRRGNVVDLAIAVVIGGAFNAIVTSLVTNLIMPLLSLVTLGYDFTKLHIQIGSGANAANLTYGNLIAAIINFLMIALVIFLIVKAYNKVADKKIAQEVVTKACPYCGSKIPEVAVRCPSCTTILDPDAVPYSLR